MQMALITVNKARCIIAVGHDGYVFIKILHARRDTQQAGDHSMWSSEELTQLLEHAVLKTHPQRNWSVLGSCSAFSSIISQYSIVCTMHNDLHRWCPARRSVY